MAKIFIFFVAVFCAQHAFAQHGGSFEMSYPIAMPLGDMKDYIEKTSFRGLTLEFNKRQKSNLDIGIELGWNVFYEKVGDRVYTKETASISGIQYRYTNAVPMLVGAKYYAASNNAMLAPYAGVGLGTVYIDRATDFGLYRISTTTWQFCVRPEVGIKLQGKQGVAGLAGVKYYGAFGNGDLDGQSYVSFNIGVSFSSF